MGFLALGASLVVGWENLIYKWALLQVVVPVLIVAVVLGLFTKRSVPLVLYQTGIPLGIASSSMCLIELLQTTAEAAGFEQSIAQSMLGLGYGLLISLLGLSILNLETPDPKVNAYANSQLPKLLIITGASASILYTAHDMAGIGAFLSLPSLLIVLSAILFTVNGKQPAEKTNSTLAGLVYGALAGVVIGLLGYLFSGMDPKGLGGAVAVALLALTYSGLTFFCVVLWAGEEQLDTKSITIKNWHLIEIYALWVLLIYAPISLRELLIETL